MISSGVQSLCGKAPAFWLLVMCLSVCMATFVQYQEEEMATENEIKGGGKNRLRSMIPENAWEKFGKEMKQGVSRP